jgi:hypothetical protein
MRLWTEDDDETVRVVTRIWRWRIAAMLVVVAVILMMLVLSRI